MHVRASVDCRPKCLPHHGFPSPIYWLALIGSGAVADPMAVRLHIQIEGSFINPMGSKSLMHSLEVEKSD